MSNRFLSYVVILVVLMFSVESYARSAKTLMKKAEDAWSQGKYTKASYYYDRASKKLKSQSKKAEAQFYRGLSFYQRGEWGSALDSFESALKFKPTKKIKQQLHYYIGLGYYANQFHANALKHFEKAVKLALSADTTRKAAMMVSRLKSEKEKKFSLFTSMGYQFDNNVPLNPINGDKLNSFVDNAQGHALNITLRPEFSTTFGDRSVFSLENESFVNYHLTNTLHEYDNFNNKTKLSFTNTATFRNYAVYIDLPFAYELQMTQDRKKALDQVSALFYTKPNVTFVYSPRWDTQIGTEIIHGDYKEHFTRGETEGRDGLKWSYAVKQGYSFWGTRFIAGYKLERMLPRGGWYKGHVHAMMVEYEMPNLFWGSDLELTFMQNWLKIIQAPIRVRAEGSNFMISWVKVFDNLLGVSMNGTVSKNAAEPSTTSYKRAAAGVNLFYNF